MEAYLAVQLQVEVCSMTCMAQKDKRRWKAQHCTATL